MDRNTEEFRRKCNILVSVVSFLMLLIAISMFWIDDASTVEKVPCDFTVVSLSSDGLLLRPRESTDGEPRQLYVYWGKKFVRKIEESGVCRS